MLINVHGNITFFFFFLTCTQTLQIWERHQPGDMTVSEQGSPDTEVGVDLAQAIQQPADGGRRQKSNLGVLYSSQPSSKGIKSLAV